MYAWHDARWARPILGCVEERKKTAFLLVPGGRRQGGAQGGGWVDTGLGSNSVEAMRGGGGGIGGGSECDECEGWSIDWTVLICVRLISPQTAPPFPFLSPVLSLPLCSSLVVFMGAASPVFVLGYSGLFSGFGILLKSLMCPAIKC